MEIVFAVIILCLAAKGVAAKVRENPSQARQPGLLAHEKEQAKQEWIERSRARHERRIQKVRRKAEHLKDKDQLKGQEWLSRKNEQLKKARSRREAFAAKRGEVWDTAKDKAKGTAQAMRERRNQAVEDRAWDENTRRDDQTRQQLLDDEPESSGEGQEIQSGEVEDSGDTPDNVHPLRPRTTGDRHRVHVPLPRDVTLTEHQGTVVQQCQRAIINGERLSVAGYEWNNLPPAWRARILDTARIHGDELWGFDEHGVQRPVAELDGAAGMLTRHPTPIPEAFRSTQPSQAGSPSEGPVLSGAQTEQTSSPESEDSPSSETEPSPATSDEESPAEPLTPADTPLSDQKGPSMSEQTESNGTEMTETAGYAEITSLDGAQAYTGAMSQFCSDARARLEQLQAEIQSLTESIQAELGTQETALSSLQSQGLGDGEIAQQLTEGYEQTQTVETAAQDMDESATELGEALQTAESCYATAEQHLGEQQTLQEQISTHGEDNVADSTAFYAPA